MFGLLGTCLEVDVFQSVELVHHDVNIVASYSCALNGDAFALIGAGNGMEFTAFHLALFLFKVGCHEAYTARVANENHLVGELFRTQMEDSTYGAS